MDYIKQETEAAVREASRLFYGAEGLDSHYIYQKGVANYVTQVDYSVQDFLLNELKRILPGSNIITEESNENRYELDRPSWILDPVDGTTNLMYGYRHSAVSLALYVESKPVLGIIYNPYLDEMFTAEAGRGAYLNGRPIKASNAGALEESLIGFGTTPYDKRKAEEIFDITARVFSSCRDVRRSGSAALDLVYVACGRMDGFFELNLQPWDYAAGILLIKEAGGEITNWQGEVPNLSASDSIIAANTHIHQALRKLVNG